MTQSGPGREPLVLLGICIAALIVSAIHSYEPLTWLLEVAPVLIALLGTQGDVRDTQWDMCMALVGALAAQLLLSREQEREIRRLIFR
jgi:putative membrane protein